MPDLIEHPLVILHSFLNEDSLFLLMYSLPGCDWSYLTCWVLCPVFVSAPQKQLCVLSWRDPSICRVLFFSSSFVIRRVLCPCYDLLDVDLCVNNLSPALCKTTRYRMLPRQTSASECFLEWRLCFCEEKVFLSGCSPRASCCSERSAGGSFEVKFRSTQPICFLLAFSYPHRRVQAFF